jgi:hypothetical protein
VSPLFIISRCYRLKLIGFKLEFPSQTLELGMETSLTPTQARAKFRKAVQAYFRKLVNDVRSADGLLPEVAKQIGVTRQMLEQYAEGSLPTADVLLTAMLKWDWIVRIDNPDATPAWCEFSMSDVDRESKKLKRQPLQLLLLDGLTELDGSLETLKKSVAKVESEIGRSLNKAG